MAEAQPPAEIRSDWDSLRAISDWLRPCHSSDGSAPEAPADWGAFIALASRHMVAPALGWAWAEKQVLPAEVAQVFQGLYQMNRDRNLRHLEAIGSVAAALNAEGVVPMLLKGSAMLADRTYPDSGMRVILDCDILVPRESLERAAAILEALNYHPTCVKPHLRGDHHLPALLNLDNGVRIELHYDVLPKRFHALIDAQSFYENGREITVGKGRALVPAASDMIAHNVVHMQMMDQRYRTAYPHLRQLLDIAMLRARYDDEIDWDELANRFRGAGIAAVLSDNLALVEGLLGQAAPAELPCNPTKAENRVRRAFARGPMARFAKSAQWTLSDAIRVVSKDPRWIFIWVKNARKRGSITGGLRRRAKPG